jgi:membrane-bound lytic murein transglycosylase D
MRTAWLTLALACFISVGWGQTNTLTLDDVMDSAQQWAEENIDPEVLRQLSAADQQKVQQLFKDLQKQLQGQYVLDVAALRDAAKVVLPLLERSEETLPYGMWLKAQMDYLDVADQLLRTIPPPKVEPGEPPKPRPNPPAQIEREVWIKQLTDRPWPPAAKAYVTRLKPLFAAQKIPAELVWLAEVESSFDPRALSPEGAAGLFQLMPATAKRFGLKLRLPDQRYQPEPSATAAAKFLRLLHDRFKDWRLVLAAYNAGEGTVQRLLERHEAKTFDTIATHLPAETQMYVPRFEAVLLHRERLKLEQF